MIMPKAENISVIASPNRMYIQLRDYSQVAYCLLSESDMEFITILKEMCIIRINFIRNMWQLADLATAGILAFKIE